MAVASGENLEKLEDMIVRAAESTAAHVRAAKAAIGEVIFGQDVVVERALITVLSGGHALLVGVPGLAKTKLVETMGTALGLDARRIQFTPDLMPSDILGTEVLEESAGGKRSFRFIAGPVFAQLLMADEINRASPRTQSALLQAMQEQHVTIAGARHDLPKPFHVLATQNPLEQEGTYPLPEAQLDRFLMEIDVDYPDLEAERKILFDTTGADQTQRQGGDDRRRPDRRAAAGAPAARRRERGRGDSRAGALGAPGSRGRRPRQSHLLGTGTAREPGADARGARPRACSTAALRRRSTTSSSSPSPCSSIAWRSPSPRAPRARRSATSSAGSRRASDNQTNGRAPQGSRKRGCPAPPSARAASSRRACRG